MTLDQPTLRWYVENKWWHNRRLELSTRATYDQRLRLYPLPRFGDQLQVNIACADIQAWLTELKEHKSLKPYYVAQCYKLLQTILAAKKGTSAIRDGYLTHNPCAGVDLDTIPRRQVTILTPTQSDAVIAAMNPWYQPIPLLVSDTGLRWGEILGLPPRDLTFPQPAGLGSRGSVPDGREFSTLRVTVQVPRAMDWRQRWGSTADR